MHSVHGKLTGINTWFIIEILSFYGYILSAMLFICRHTITSSMGYNVKQKRHCEVAHCEDDAYDWKHDFISYYTKDLDWAAFVQILFNVNIGLILIDEFIIFRDKEEIEEERGEKLQFPLRKVQYILFANHLLQMIFLKDFYDMDGHVNTKNNWVWVIHAFSYTYVVYVYYNTDLKKEAS